MTRTDITQTDNTDLKTGVPNFDIGVKRSDGVSQSFGKNRWTNNDFGTHYAYYLKTSLKKPIDAFATWVVGKGFVPIDEETNTIIGTIRGWGEDTFQSILWNMLVTKKYHGDSFAEIIRDPNTGKIANLKVLDPSVITTITEKGVIVGYEQREKIDKDSKVINEFKTQEIFHLCNDRVVDNIHGIAVADAAAWKIDAKEEAMRDWRRISHRSTIRVLYVEEDDKERLANLKRDYKDGIKDGEILILPVKKGEAEFQDLTLPPVEAFLSWIRYLTNEIFQDIGVPKVILGGSEEFTESSSKISYLTYEQIYTREIVDLEADIKNQLQISLTFSKPASIKNELLQGEDKKGVNDRLGFQPNDATAGAGK